VGTERRKYTRLTTDHNIHCQIAGIDFVHVVGFGSGGSGMRVITNKELPDDEFDLVLDLQDEKPAIQAQARAVWQESWNFEIFHRHAAGITLSGLQAEDSERIDAVIRNFPASEDLPEQMP